MNNYAVIYLFLFLVFFSLINANPLERDINAIEEAEKLANSEEKADQLAIH